ncbi:ATP-binding protein [Leptolyngbya sp. O-77]|uniref:ATP-binding protein n=1 Tax=Leptolyngbya sp. O-77 TaxID=1080068 RepID=UPI00074D4B42|nr:ATP-binding protein [Leptolyngbya sp. O-77]BAU41702.1 Phytochrome-like protein cph1 [Leptolyngbya sp. O-77]
MRRGKDQCSILNRQVFSNWSRLPVSYRGAAIAAIPATCLAIALGSWVWSINMLSGTRKQIEATRDVIAATDNVLIDLLNAETGVRGYGITRNTSYLAPYERAKASLDESLNRLEVSYQYGVSEAERDRRSQEVAQLKQLVDRSVGLLDDKVNVLINQSDVPITDPLFVNLLDEGKGTVDATRAFVVQLQKREQSRLDAYTIKRSRLLDTTSTIIGLTAGLSLMASTAAVYLFRQLDRDLRSREQLLQESRQLLQAIVGNVVDGVVTLDEHDEIEIFNTAAEQLFGYRAEEVEGQPLDVLLAPPELPASEAVSPETTSPEAVISGTTSPETASPEAASPETANNTLSLIQPGQPHRVIGRRQDGSHFPLEISISEIQFENRRIAIIRDITQFLETEAKLKARADELDRLTHDLAETNEMLEDRNRELEQFAYVASHDLKAPLRAIANLSEWIEEDLSGQLPPENQQQLHLLRGRVHRMEALINGLLEYSRVGRVESPVERVSLSVLLDEVIDSIDPPDTFTITIPPDLPTLITKRLPLRQVFANLISNAVKHHDRTDGQVRIGVRDLGDRYEFSVADDGPGIAPEYHRKIFMIFQTLQARDVKESTGVGLSIVKRIVETEGGTIRLDSEEGAGTTFYFTWNK